MEQDLQLLQEIQEWDKEIYALAQILEEIPAELSDVNQRVENERLKLRKLQDELKTFQLKQKEKEVELNSKEDNIRKYEAQLTQVKTNKEYSSLQVEIKSLKADNSLLEESIIHLFDQVETIQKNMEDQKKNLEVTEEELKKKKEELEESAKQVHEKMDQLAGKRKEKIKDVKPEIAILYEQIVTKKRGLALVQVEGEVCPACQMQLRPQILNEVKMKDKITFCDNCSRMLYSL